jgi:YfiH family protein
VYFHRSTFGPVDLAFTDRFGGVSAVPYDELNLALESGDDTAALEENHRRLLADFAPEDALADLHQVHGASVVVAGPGGFSTPPDADGVVALEPGVALMVRAADCVPVLLADPDAEVIGAAHAGRPGLVAGVVPATVQRMRELGAGSRPGAITAWIGPYVCGACYEVPEAMQQDGGALAPESISTTSWGTPALDIGAGVRAQLVAAGVEVYDVSRCTRESPDLYSYRRDGDGAGRIAGLIRLQP